MLPILLLGAAVSCSGCDVDQQVVVRRSSTHSPHVFYLIGASHSNDALIAEIRKLRTLLANGIGQPEPTLSAVARHCGKCHRGDSAKGSFRIDAMTPEDKLRAIRAMATGAMPPEKPLQPDEKNDLLTELTQADQPTPVPPPEPIPQEQSE